MKHYFFGYLFVRLNKLFAVLVVLAGAILGYLRYSQALLEADASKYKSSDILMLRLNTLSQVYAQTSRRVMQFRRTNAYPERFSAANVEVIFFNTCTTLEQFEELRSKLQQIETAGKTMKRFVMDRFDSIVSDILNKLRGHAQQLRASDPVPPQTSAQITVTTQPIQRTEGIFSARLTRNDVDERMKLLSQAKDSLSTLESVSEQPENKQKLRDAISEIEEFFALFPTITEPVREPRPLAGQEQTSKPQKVFNVERVAAQLSRLQSAVEEAMLSSWAMDEAYEKAVESFSAEREKCDRASIQIKRIWRATGSGIISTLVIALVIAFMLMVAADLIRAILDSAENTGAVADAYRAASP